MKRLFMIALLLPVAVWSAKTGYIGGSVTDATTGAPLQGANIVVDIINLGAAADIKGQYLIQNVPEGKYELIAMMMGYTKVRVTRVTVHKNDTTWVHIQMNASTINADEVVTVMADKVGRKQEDADDLFGGIRGGMMKPSVLATGVSVHPMREAGPDWNTEEYNKIDESGFLEVLSHPMSTFAADVDAASYANARRFIMRDQLPYKDADRSEEFINYFNYDYPEPEGSHPLSINIEYGACPWNQEHRLVHIGLQGKKLKRDETKPSNLVFLLDVSGSMNTPKKLPLLQKAFNLLVDQLNDRDRVAIVVYAGAAGEVLKSTPGSEKQKIKDAVNRLNAGGSTAGGAGIELAYNIAEKNRIRNGNNRVILATDGDFNVGISSTSELTRFIEKKRDKGIFLTVLGFGMGNYKDHRLQELADRGNGNHAYIDNIMEAKKVLVHEITATLYTIAKDVKIQVEFNPAKIHAYRLIGYENRELEDKDFKDDTKDAGEIGAGHSVTALYEIVPADSKKKTEPSELKYQTTQIKDVAFKTDEVLTVRIRYKKPDGNKSIEFNKTWTAEPAEAARLSDNFRFSAAVAEFAMLLRDSEFKADASLEQVKKLAQSALGQDPHAYRAEFLTLVNRVEMLKDSD